MGESERDQNIFSAGHIYHRESVCLAVHYYHYLHLRIPSCNLKMGKVAGRSRRSFLFHSGGNLQETEIMPTVHFYITFPFSAADGSTSIDGLFKKGRKFRRASVSSICDGSGPKNYDKPTFEIPAFE